MTRRSALKVTALAFAPAVPLAGAMERLAVAHGHDLLAIESARGFQAAVGAEVAGPYGKPSILAGLRTLTGAEARGASDRVHRGAWLLIESGLGFADCTEVAAHRSQLRELFGLNLARSLHSPHPGDHYAHYRWPVGQTVRHFGAALPVFADPEEVIACIGDRPVAVRKRVGAGGVIYLGTALGPILFSGDSGAIALARAITKVL